MQNNRLNTDAVRIFARLCRREPRAGRYLGILFSNTGEPAVVIRHQPEKDTALSAVFLPSNPESLVFDMTDSIRHGLDRGMRLYINADGRRALLKKQAPGWVRYGSNEHVRLIPPCAA